jgi:hypothetical protein
MRYLSIFFVTIMVQRDVIQPQACAEQWVYEIDQPLKRAVKSSQALLLL